MTQAAAIAAFLKAQGWDDARRLPLQADFSTRQFFRLSRIHGKPQSAILMVAAAAQKTREFAVIATLLRQAEISAPEIYGTAPDLGLTLMEDLGDANIGKLLDQGREAWPFYRRAAEMLAHWHHAARLDSYASPPMNQRIGQPMIVIPAQAGIQRPAPAGRMKPEREGETQAVGSMPHALAIARRWIPACAGMTPVLDGGEKHKAERGGYYAVEGLPIFDAALFTEQVGLFVDECAPSSDKEEFVAAWRTVLQPLDALPQTLILRDFMPDNLIDLPERRDWRGVGVVDFQDGGTGPLPYDLASLCEAVRRDGGAAMLEPVLAHYHARNPVMPLAELARTCRILAAQRHMRILGIVARLARDPARHDKRAYLPRIAAHLQGLLQDEALRPVRKWCEDCGVSLETIPQR